MTEYWVATAFLSALANTKTQNPNRGGKGGSLKERTDIRKAGLSYFYIYIYIYIKGRSLPRTCTQKVYMTFANCFFFLCNVFEICPEMYAETKMAKTRQNSQIRQANFALTNLTKFAESVKSVNIHLV